MSNTLFFRDTIIASLTAIRKRFGISDNDIFSMAWKDYYETPMFLSVLRASEVKREKHKKSQKHVRLELNNWDRLQQASLALDKSPSHVCEALFELFIAKNKNNSDCPVGKAALDNKIIRLSLDGFRAADIMKKLFVSKAKVYAVQKTIREKLDKTKVGVKRRMDIRDEDILLMAEKGFTPSDIAKQKGIDRSTVWRVLKKAEKTKGAEK